MVCIRLFLPSADATGSPRGASRWPLLAGLLCVVAWLAHAPDAAAQSFLGKKASDWERQLKEGKDDKARRSAAFALGKLGNSALAAAGSLKKALREDTSPSVREAAAMALGEIGRGSLKVLDDPDLVAVLTQALAKDSDALVRRSAALSLGKFGPDAKSALAALESAVVDPNPAVRQNVAWALGRIGSEGIPGLRKALKDEDSLVKRDAAGSLGRLEPEEARAALNELVACCNSGSSELRLAALGVLNKIVTREDGNLIPALQPALADKDLEVRQNVALTLARIGGPEAAPALPILLDALRNGDPELKQQAASAIGNLGEAAASAVPLLINALSAADKELRRDAALGLGGIGEKAEPAIPALVKLLATRGEFDEARIEAAVALAKIGPRQAAEDAVPSLLKVLEDPKNDARVRERVIWALRVHKLNLGNFPGVFPAFAKILHEPKQKENRMLRYDCAYMLGVLQAMEAPDKALDVLLDFLHDDTILIFKGKAVQPGSVKGTESKGNTSTVKEEGTGDGRVMAIQALTRIGGDRVVRRNDIVQQLRAIATNPKTFAELKEKTKELLETIGK